MCCLPKCDLQLTFVIHSDFSEAKGSSCHVRSLNDDVAKCLSGLCTVDDCSLAGGHWGVVLVADRVRAQEARSSCHWIIVRQPDHEAVQACSVYSVHGCYSLKTSVIWRSHFVLGLMKSTGLRLTVGSLAVSYRPGWLLNTNQVI